jgi:alpha-amylase
MAVHKARKPGFFCLLASSVLMTLRPSRASAQANVSDPAYPPNTQGYNVSDPVILQDFNSSYLDLINKMPDVFQGGYGAIYLPPPGYSTTTNSVGYDIYNRFDLGTPSQPTTYGTQNEFAAVVQSIHGYGGNAYADLLWNDSGSMDANTSGFAASGGYPGLAVTLQDTNPGQPGYNTLGYEANGSSGAATYMDGGTTYHYYGDFHDPTEPANGVDGQVAGLDDIAQETNWKFIRQPTTAGNPENIPEGTTPWNGYLANVPSASNAQYYPDLSGTPRTETDTQLGQNFTIYPFVASSPMTGTPVEETAIQYLMRYAQWMVQVMGVDGFRVDAAYNQPISDLEDLDVVDYNASDRTLLNGKTEQIYNFSEVFTGNASTISQYVSLNDTNPSSSTVQGNRDALDFPLYFAMTPNLSTANSAAVFGESGGNSWYNVVGKDLSVQNTGSEDGAEGVKFVSEQDLPAATLMQVAYAYTLMLPGEATVYFNAQQFNNEQSNTNGGEFPQGGAGDENDSVSGALGGADDTNVQNSAMTNLNITNLVDLRNRYGRGNYREDWIEQNLYAFERTDSSLIVLSNSTTPAVQSRTFAVTFAPGTWLEEMTRNATSSYADPNGIAPQFIQVQTGGALQNSGGGQVTATFLNNATYAQGSMTSSYQTNDGFLIYALPTPTGTASVSNVSSVMSPQTTTHTAPGSFESSTNYSNGINRNSAVDVIDADTTPSFTLSLNTVEANLQVTPTEMYHDQDADGDNALFTIDGGAITVAAGGVTSTTPGSNGENTTPGKVAYGYQGFANSSPGYYNANGNGAYSQTIDTAGFSIGYHYIEIISFRHNPVTTEPDLYNDWYETIYVDRGTPSSSLESFQAFSSAPTNNNNRQMQILSDGTTTSEYVFLNLPVGITNSQILNMITTGNQTIGGVTYQGGLAGQTDSNLFAYGFDGIQNGNNVATFVSYRPDGNESIQRFTENQNPNLGIATTDGLGLGDINADGHINTTDVLDMYQNVNSNGTKFNPAGDYYGDGLNALEDWYAMGNELQLNGQLSTMNTAYVSPSTMSYYVSVNQSIAQPTGSSIWFPSAGGSWSTASNWNGSKVPQTAGQSVTLGPTNSAPATVTLDGAWTAGALTFASSYAYTLAPGNNGSLTLNNGSSPAAINVTFGTHSISVPIALTNGLTITTSTSTNSLAISGSIDGSGGLTIQGPGTITLSGTNSYTGATSFASGQVIVSASGAIPNGSVLSIGSSTTTAGVKLPTTGGVIQTSSFVLNSGSTLDIGAASLVFPDGGSASSAEALVQQYVGSSAITSAYVTNNGGYGIAYADGSDAGLNDPNLTAGQVVVEPDLIGDTDLSGTVNIHDLQNLLSDFNAPGFWDQGNFNGHADVDISDLQALLSNFNTSTTLSYSELTMIENLAGEFGDMAIPNSNGAGFTLVAIPEPSITILLAGAAGVIGLRRRRGK